MRNNVLPSDQVFTNKITQIELDTRYKEKFVFDLCAVHRIDYEYNTEFQLHTVEMEFGVCVLSPKFHNYFLRHESDDYICNILIEEQDTGLMPNTENKPEAINTLTIYGAMNIVEYYEDIDSNKTIILIKGVLL